MSIAFISQKDEQKRNGGQTQKNITTTAPYDDGYLWRKYGEKKIRGNAFPRSYYRCTYREDKGCQATKQVQQQCRSDPPLFLVTQKGEHTCNTAPATPGHGYMVQCHYQLNRELQHLQSASSNLLPALSMLDHCGDCTLNPEFSYSSRPTTNQFVYDYRPCSRSSEEQYYENCHSVLDNSAWSTPEAYAACIVSDSNFSDDSFHENFSSSDMKLEEFDFDEFCEFVLW